jgi:two-component system sensor histidine kinase KdpD
MPDGLSLAICAAVFYVCLVALLLRLYASLGGPLDRSDASPRARVDGVDGVDEPVPRSNVVGMRIARSLAAAFGLVVLATLIAWVPGLKLLAETDIVLVYLVAITVAAARFGRVAAVATSALSVAAFDVFFVEPVWTFVVADSRHVLTFAMMFVVGVFVSAVATRLRQQELDARERERRTQSLLALTRVTSAADDAAAISAGLEEHAALAFSCRAAILPAAHRPPVDALVLPLRETQVLALSSPDGAPFTLDAAQRELADAFVRQAAAAYERLRLADDARAVAMRRRTEEIRTSLLSTVSHDLRTPLASITGAATTLIAELRTDGDGAHLGTQLADKDRRALLELVADQAFQLERLVSSLLDMNRVEAGALILRKEWVPLEEIVGSALARTRARLAPRTIRTSLARGVPMLHVDPVLFEQVLVNLLENAAKHTPAHSVVTVEATADHAGVHVAVVDDGAGVPPGVDVFEKFVRGPGAGGGGLGLGLAICRSIVTSHGGVIDAARGVGDVGVRFAIEMPLPPPAPHMPEHDQGGAIAMGAR